MKKIIAGLVAAVLLVGSANTVQAEDLESGGVKGFFSGCCFGTRAVGDYNEKGIGDGVFGEWFITGWCLGPRAQLDYEDGIGNREFVPWFLVGCCLGGRTQIDYAEGKDFHWRDIGRVIPYVGVVFSIWDGIDGANGATRTNLAERYGSTYY